MARDPRVHHELVLIDQSQLRQRQRERHASNEQSLCRLSLELLNGVPKMVPAHELRVPIDAAKKYVVSSTLDHVDWNAELVRAKSSIQSGLAPAGTGCRHPASIIS